ncbi:MAG: DNA-processing protein DprA [Bacilli bacterium]|nr:DNA-processing protein DprA [Bacilli bacterium]
MKNDRDVLILLATTMCVGDNMHPFSNTEIYKIITKLKLRNHTLKDMYGKTEDEIFTLFFEKNEKVKENVDFIKRISVLLSREPNLSFSFVEMSEWAIKIVTILDDAYPKAIKNVLGEKSPVLLYYCGNLEILNKPAIGFSGSRAKRANKKDYNDTQAWSQFACQHGYTIVVGGASGIDSFALQSALNNQTSFIEVLANETISHIKIGPISNAISNNRGLIISECDPFAPYSVGKTLGRNKFIYILSKYVIVIKAIYEIKNKKKIGGTWNGAIENLNSHYKNLLVFDNQKNNGNKELIKLGAMKISYPDDPISREIVLAEGNIYQRKSATDDYSKKIISVLKDPQTLNEINFTKNELAKLPEIKQEISKVKFSIDEMNLNKKLLSKIKKYCEQKANCTMHQMSLFDFTENQ